MSKTPKTETHIRKINACSGNLIVNWEERTVYGTVDTPYGIIGVYSQNWGKPEGYTQLLLIMDGTEYYRTIQAGYTKPYLITLSRRFAEEMVMNEYENEGKV